MTVTRVSRLLTCGVFRDFEWKNNLLDFGRSNLIYGWNGTGKTTLSRLFRDIELRRTPATGDATVRIDSRDVQGPDFPQLTLQVRVFNRDFINESVFPVGGGDLPPIFIVGKESVEKQKEINRLKAERNTKEDELRQTRKAKNDSERSFDQHCVDRARVIKDTLRSPGANRYNNYDKAGYKEDTEKLAANGNAGAYLLSNEERRKLLAQHRANPKPRLAEVSYRMPSPLDLADLASEILHTTVVSATIEALINDTTLSEWTRQGLRLHKDRQAEKCLFCEQPIPTGRLAALEAHFSAEYEKFLNWLEKIIGELNGAAKQASEVKLPNRAEFYDDLADEYNTAEESLRQTVETIQTFQEALSGELAKKKAKPFERVLLTVEVPTIGEKVVDRLNEVIQRHNRACDDFASRVSKARDRLASDMIDEGIDEFVRFKDAVQQISDRITGAECAVLRLSQDIDRLEREIVQHRQPAEELNDDLRKYLGHDELRLMVKDTGYTIMRNGAAAESLSEGETTAIALLYFLKSLRDRSLDLKRGVVVLDDPVSSLDSNALYLAFGFIRERTKDAGQLFVFTHNFAFFRLVRNWFHHLKGQNKRGLSQRPARFFMLDCVRGGGQRCATVHLLDPLLEEYESEYQYLFARIYRAASVPAPAALEDSYILPNMARRLLESFLAFRLPGKAGELWQKMQSAQFDEAKKVRILRFLHTYSHNSSVGDPEHDPSLLAEAGSVLKNLLEFIEAQDKSHFDEMVKLVNSPGEEEEDE